MFAETTGVSPRTYAVKSQRRAAGKGHPRVYKGLSKIIAMDILTFRTLTKLITYLSQKLFPNLR